MWPELLLSIQCLDISCFINIKLLTTSRKSGSPFTHEHTSRDCPFQLLCRQLCYLLINIMRTDVSALTTK